MTVNNRNYHEILVDMIEFVGVLLGRIDHMKNDGIDSISSARELRSMFNELKREVDAWQVVARGTIPLIDHDTSFNAHQGLRNKIDEHVNDPIGHEKLKYMLDLHLLKSNSHRNIFLQIKRFKKWVDKHNQSVTAHKHLNMLIAEYEQTLMMSTNPTYLSWKKRPSPVRYIGPEPTPEFNTIKDQTEYRSIWGSDSDRSYSKFNIGHLGCVFPNDRDDSSVANTFDNLSITVDEAAEWCVNTDLLKGVMLRIQHAELTDIPKEDNIDYVFSTNDRVVILSSNENIDYVKAWVFDITPHPDISHIAATLLTSKKICSYRQQYAATYNQSHLTQGTVPKNRIHEGIYVHGGIIENIVQSDLFHWSSSNTWNNETISIEDIIIPADYGHRLELRLSPYNGCCKNTVDGGVYYDSVLLYFGNVSNQIITYKLETNPKVVRSLIRSTVRNNRPWRPETYAGYIPEGNTDVLTGMEVCLEWQNSDTQTSFRGIDYKVTTDLQSHHYGVIPIRFANEVEKNAVIGQHGPAYALRKLFLFAHAVVCPIDSSGVMVAFDHETTQHGTKYGTINIGYHNPRICTHDSYGGIKEEAFLGKFVKYELGGSYHQGSIAQPVRCKGTVVAVEQNKTINSSIEYTGQFPVYVVSDQLTTPGFSPDKNYIISYSWVQRPV